MGYFRVYFVRSELLDFFLGGGCLVARGTCVKFANVDLRCMSLLRWGRRAREFQKHCHQLKIPVKKRPKTVSFFIIPGEMEKLYRQITETQRINQNMMIHSTVTADLRINTSKTHEHPAASISCLLFFLFIYRQVSERKRLSTGSNVWQGWKQSSTSPSSTSKVQSAQLG